ncbi:pyrimidine/purine nucleoside phosphorylase, partial [Acidithiobacillus ferrooxidans]|nr:pyrimidine/purine nucleoside phosphorylase [Acidithiobacillus ferrooxidans]
QELHAGDSMVIPASQSYRLEVVEPLDYLLSS